jgi:hypothetical protein
VSDQVSHPYKTKDLAVTLANFTYVRLLNRTKCNCPSSSLGIQLSRPQNEYQCCSIIMSNKHYNHPHRKFPTKICTQNPRNVLRFQKRPHSKDLGSVM